VEPYKQKKNKGDKQPEAKILARKHGRLLWINQNEIAKSSSDLLQISACIFSSAQDSNPDSSEHRQSDRERQRKKDREEYPLLPGL
jgi:hypothetical protein